MHSLNWQTSAGKLLHFTFRPKNIYQFRGLTMRGSLGLKGKPGSASVGEMSMNQLAEIISRNENQIREEWLDGMSKSVQRSDLISKAELDEQCQSILAAIVAGVRTSGPIDIGGTGWDAARELLQSISASRARQGFSPIDVATYVLSLKRPLFAATR